MLLKPRAVLAELVGTAALVMAVVGSGIMATRLTTDVGLQLLINAIATIFALGVLIALFAPVSGAHFNPAVSLALAARGRATWREVAAYIPVQLVGGMLGAMLAQAMYELPLVSQAGVARTGTGQWLGEVVATAGLVGVVLSRATASIAVPAWIGAAYFVTSSTSFANPAVTFGRAFTDTFAGIAWTDVPAFVIAQIAGAAIVVGALLPFKESA